MISHHDKNNIAKLIKEVAHGASLDSLILLFADHHDMAASCEKLLSDLENCILNTVQWLENECLINHIDQHQLLNTLSPVFTLYSLNSYQDPYNVLGLKPGADPEEIKDAYRKLSRQYHPDLTTEKKETATKKFISIVNAYTKLTNAGKSKPFPSHPTVSVPKKHSNRPSFDKKRAVSTVFMLSILCMILLFISFLAHSIYKNNSLLSPQNQEIADRSFTHPQGIPVDIPSNSDIESKPSISKDTIEETSDSLQSSIDHADPRYQVDVVDSGLQSKDSNNNKQIDIVDQRQLADNRVANDRLMDSTQESWHNSDTKSSQETKEDTTNRKIERDLNYQHSDPVYKQGGIETASSSKMARTIGNGQKENIKRTNRKKSSAAKRPGVSMENTVDISRDESLEKRSILASIKKERNQLSSHSPKKKKKTIQRDQTKTDQEVIEQSKITIGAEEQKIYSFLGTYTRLYNQKDIAGFSKLFEPDALENDKPFKDQITNYVKLFNRAKSLTLTIFISSWQHTDNVTKLDGDFFLLSYFFNSKTVVRTKGPIAFILTNNNDQYKVRRLSYSFNEDSLQSSINHVDPTYQVGGVDSGLQSKNSNNNQQIELVDQRRLTDDIVANNHLIDSSQESWHNSDTKGSQKTVQRDQTKTDQEVSEQSEITIGAEEQKIYSFLGTYTRLYNQKDIAGFSKLFEPDALENDKPFKDQITNYVKLFNRAKSLTLTIFISSWQHTDNVTKLDGDFFLLSYFFNSKTVVRTKGKIAFILTNNNNEYKVRRLNYSLNQ